MNMNMSMEIRYIEPAALHDEMLRLRQEEQMDFLECLTGMDWGEPDAAKDTPDTPRGLGVVYQLESTVTGKRTAILLIRLEYMHHAIVIFDIYHRWLICTLRHAFRYGIYSRVGNITLGSSGLLYIILSRLESGEFYTAGFVSLFCHELFMIRCPIQCELRIRKRCLQNIIRLVDTYAPSDLLFFFCINCL